MSKNILLTSFLLISQITGAGTLGAAPFLPQSSVPRSVHAAWPARGRAAESHWRRGIARKSGRFNRGSRMGHREQIPRRVTTVEHVTSRVSLVNGKRRSFVCTDHSTPDVPLGERADRSEVERFAVVDSFVRTKRGTAMGTASRIPNRAQEATRALEREFSGIQIQRSVVTPRAILDEREFRKLRRHRVLLGLRAFKSPIFKTNLCRGVFRNSNSTKGHCTVCHPRGTRVWGAIIRLEKWPPETRGFASWGGMQHS